MMEKGRDKKNFPMVFDEVCSHGFRRNLWGMRTAGIAISAIGTLAVLICVLLNMLEKPPVSKVSVVGQLLNLALSIGWIFLFNSDWTKIAADAYALRLLESCDRL